MNLRKEIREALKEQRSSWKEEAKKREKIWSCIEYFTSGNYNELADYQFSSEQLIKQAKDYIKGSKYEEFLKCCEKTLKEQKSESDTVGWYMDGEGGWADIPLLKKHLDSSFVGIHNDGTYFFDTEDPSERSGDMLSFRGFSEVLHRLGLKVDAHKVSDQLYKLSPQRLKIDLIEADLERGAQRDQDRRLERPELRYKHPNKFSKGATFPYADVKMMKSPINRDKLVIRFDGRSYEIMNRDTGEFFAEELSHIELEDTLVQLDVDREMTRSLVVQSESGQEVNIP